MGNRGRVLLNLSLNKNTTPKPRIQCDSYRKISNIRRTLVGNKLSITQM